MASLLEDTSNLMPGRSRKHWSLDEAKAVGKGQKGLLAIAQQHEGQWVGLSDVTYRDVPVHFGQLMKAASALAKKGMIEFKDNKFRLAEDVAGAPGAFAVSDAEPPSLEAMKADLIDRVRNPRWEYPSWALPKVNLDEEGDEEGDEDGLEEVGGIQYAQRANSMLQRKQREFTLEFWKMKKEVDLVADDLAQRSDSDGIWDGMQGGMADIDIASRKLRAKAKEINKIRDGRKDW